MQQFLKAIILPFPLVVLTATASSGGPLDDLAKGAVGIFTAPVDTTIGILRGDDPVDVIQDHVGQHVDVGRQAWDTLDQANQLVNSVPREQIANTFGHEWARGFDMLTTSQRVQAEMTFTAGRFLGNCLQANACTLQQMTAMPLAAQLRDAYRVYLPYSYGIDGVLSAALSPAVPSHVINRARLTIGHLPDLTVPGMLNSGHEAFGHGHAVTIGNLIIFSRQLDLQTCGDFMWLLHELRHVEQYGTYSSNEIESIDGFAVDYVYHFNSIENDAESVARSWMGHLNFVHSYGC